MGIQGLLPLLRSVTDRRHLSSLAGKTVAVDTYCWLHRGAYGCAVDLFHGRPTSAFVDLCLQRIRLFLHFGVKLVLVFDGGGLPMKAGKERERDAGRSKARLKAEELVNAGRSGEAHNHMVKAIDITPDMAQQLVAACRKAFPDSQVKCIVAPYEADAQLAYLEAHGLVDAVVSEDSDLLLFGVQRLCVKLDGKSGWFEEIRAERIGDTREMDLHGCSLKRLRQMCILAGCDYLESVSGMGLKTANRYLTKYHSVERVVQVLRAEGRQVPEQYEELFAKAELTFSHQRVFSPTECRMMCLRPLDENAHPFEDYSFLGPLLPDSLAQAIADCIAHPVSHRPFVQCESVKPPQPVAAVSPRRATSQRAAIKRPAALEYSSLYNLQQNPVLEKRQKTIRDFFN